jgi:hypothetical protein
LREEPVVVRRVEMATALVCPDRTREIGKESMGEEQRYDLLVG